MSFVFSYRTVKHGLQQFVGTCPIFGCRAKYLVRLANPLVDVHRLDHLQQRQNLQEAKLQPKVNVVVYQSKADRARKNHYTTCNPIQTQETV